jgi:hypothetical protein
LVPGDANCKKGDANRSFGDAKPENQCCITHCPWSKGQR